MNKLLTLLLLSLSLLLNANVKNIPETAFMAGKINPQMAKSNGLFDHLIKDDLIAKELDKAPLNIKNWINQVLDNPEDLGFDNASGITYYADLVDSNLSFHVQIDLWNAKLFSNWMDSVSQIFLKKDVQQIGTLKYFAFNEAFLYYNEQGVGVIMANINPATTYLEEEDYLSYIERRNNLKSEMLHQLSMKMIRDFYGSGKKLLENKSFKKALKETKDMFVWLNTEKYIASFYNSFRNPLMGAGFGASILPSKYLEDSYNVLNLGLENGKVDVALTTYASKKSHQLFKKSFNNKFGSNFKGLVPENAIGYFGAAYDVSNLLNAVFGMVEYNEESVMNQSIGLGYSLLSQIIDEDGVEEIFSGQVYGAFLGVQEVEKTFNQWDYDEETGEYSEKLTSYVSKEPEVVFLVGLGKSGLVEKSLQLMKSFGEIEMLNGVYEIEDMMVTIKNNVLVITNSKNYILNHISTNAKNTMPLKNLNQSTFRGEFNYVAWANHFKEKADNSEKDWRVYEHISKYKGQIELKMYRKGKAYKTTVSLSLENQNYSLITVYDFMKEFYRIVNSHAYNDHYMDEVPEEIEYIEMDVIEEHEEDVFEMEVEEEEIGEEIEEEIEEEELIEIPVKPEEEY